MLLCAIVSDGGYLYGPNHGKKSWHTPRRSWQETSVLFLCYFHNGFGLWGLFYFSNCFIFITLSRTASGTNYRKKKKRKANFIQNFQKVKDTNGNKFLIVLPKKRGRKSISLSFLISIFIKI